MKRDIYQEVTDRIIDLIESGQASGDDWMRPWRQVAGEGIPTNAATGRNYRGVNVLLLWGDAMLRGFSLGLWGTYRQWQSLGCQVRKRPDDYPRGSWGTMVVQYRPAKSGDEDQEAEATEEERRRRRGYLGWATVFNVDQVDGWDRLAIDGLDDDESEVELIDRIEHYIEATGADVKRMGGEACYVKPPADYIRIPAASRFESIEQHYSALFHELTHWTGIKERCDRDMRGRFGDVAYAMEELVAELGSAFQSGTFGLEPVAREDHAEYVANWLQVLRNDKRALVTASSKAADAVEWLAERAGAAVAA